MTTPTKEEIIERALHIYQSRNHDISYNTPEIHELKESGVFLEAQRELMRSEGHEALSYLEELASEAGYDLVKNKHVNKYCHNLKDFDVSEALKSGCYVTATTGHGKSDLGMMHAEELMKQDVTIIVFDSTMDWMKRSSIPYVITVEPSVHFRYSLDMGHSIIFDMSLLDVLQQKRLVKMVCQTVWNHQVKAAQQGKPLCWFYLIFEEGHLYFPQGCMRATWYAPLVQLITGGRNFNIRFEMIVQFSSMVDKDVMKYMRQRYFGYTDEPNDMEYVTGFLGREHSKKLTGLKAGQFLYKHGREVKQIMNEPYQNTTKPKPYPKLIEEPEEKEEQKETAETDLLKLAAMALQIGALFLFLIVVMIALSGWS